MHLSSVFVALTLWVSFALGGPLSRASVETVDSDIQFLESNIASLNMQLRFFSGSIFEAAAIGAVCEQVAQANTKALQDIQSMNRMTEVEGNTIYAAVHSKLTPTILEVFDTLDARKPVLDSLGATPKVKSSLKDMESNIGPLVQTLVQTAPVDQQQRIAQEAEEILAGLKRCESTYSS